MLFALCSFACVAILLSGRAAADYTVQRGDILDISVPGAPGLHRRAPVDAGGQISVPLIGEIDAAGKSLSELRTELQNLLVAKNITRRAEVVIDVVEYRPIVVGGDVVKPGAYPYRPGMTVRDAVALAEGYDVLHLRGRDMTFEAANAQADYDAFAVEAAKQAIRVARLKAELADRHDFDVRNIPQLPVKPDILEEIKRIETQRLAADWDNANREKASLTEMLNGTKEQLAALTREREHDAAALDQQNRFVARARDLMQRGLLQNARMEELQHGLTTAQNQFYEVQARMAQAQKDIADFTRKLQTVDDERRVRLLQELQEAVTQFETARSHFEAAASKTNYTETGASPWRNPATPPKITIYGSVNGREQRRQADEGTALSPGDNVEVVIVRKPNKAAGAPGGS